MKRLLLVVVAFAAAAAGVVFGVRTFWRQPAPPAPAAVESRAAGDAGTVKFLMEQQWAIRMKLAQAKPAVVARQIVAAGRIVPAAGRHATVSPPVGGVLGGTIPRVGQAVSRGQVVAVVNQTPTAAEAAQIASSRAQVEMETARLEADRRRLAENIREAEAKVQYTRLELERARRLYEGKAYSLRQVETAEAEHRTAEAVLAAAVAQRDVLQLARTPQRVSPPDLAAHRLLAPIGGTVVRVAKASGEQVTPGDAVVEIVDLDVVWIEVSVFELDFPRLGRDMRAHFTTPAAPTAEVRGRLIDVGSVVDRETRTVRLLFEVPNPGRTLRIGLQATARLEGEEKIQALLVPREAVLEAEGKRFVYVLVSGEDFQRREVSVGDEQGGQVAILGGLKNGERVVTQGAWQLRQHELRPSAPGAHVHE